MDKEAAVTGPTVAAAGWVAGRLLGGSTEPLARLRTSKQMDGIRRPCFNKVEMKHSAAWPRNNLIVRAAAKHANPLDVAQAYLPVHCH